MAEAQFASLFAQSSDILSILKQLLSDAAGAHSTVDPVEVIKAMRESHPEMRLTPAELEMAIALAAADAGVALKSEMRRHG